MRHTAAGEVHTNDVALLLLTGVGDLDLQQEAVDLSLGQGVGTLLFERVLGRHHEERSGQRVGLVADGNLALLHRLQKGALNLGGRAVDLVGQNEVGEDGPLTDGELLALLGVDHSTDKVGGQKVGSELHPGELCVHSLGKSGDGEGLGKPRNALQKDMAVGQQADQKRVHEVLLADDDLTHLHLEGVHEEAFALDALAEFLDIYDFAHFRNNLPQS